MPGNYPHKALIDALAAAGLENIEWLGSIDAVAAFDTPASDSGFEPIAQRIAKDLKADSVVRGEGAEEDWFLIRFPSYYYTIVFDEEDRTCFVYVNEAEDGESL